MFSFCQLDADLARQLRDEGQRLAASEERELESHGLLNADSLAPKCDELKRMADALNSALERRTNVLQLSKRMHAQISQVSSISSK